MTTDTFRFAGVSTLNGECKARFANDQMRVKVLAKNGHKDIDIIELKEALTKEAAVAFLLSIDFDNGNAVVRAALEAEQAKRAPKAPKEPKAAKEPKAPKEPKAAKAPKEPKAAKAKPGPTIEAIQQRAAAKVAVDAAKAAAAAEKARTAAVIEETDDAPY